MLALASVTTSLIYGPVKNVQASRLTFRCERFGMNLGVYSEIQLFKKFYERKIFENFRVDVFE